VFRIQEEEVNEEEAVAGTVQFVSSVLLPRASKIKTVHCSTRCTKGCKGCVCAKKGERCDAKCRCNNCLNNGESNCPEFEKWGSYATFSPQETTFDPEQSGSQNIPTSPLTEDAAFGLFLDDQLLGHFVENSKAYALKQRVAILITPELIRRYFITIFAMGLAPLPSVQLYWTSTSRLRRLYSNSFVRQSLSRKEFWAISRVIHYDLDWLQAHLNEKYKYFWKPFQYLTVDEGMIAFKGRYGGRQHVRGKPHATGIKFWALCDESGYVIAFWIYEGKVRTAAKGKSANPTDIVSDLAATQENNKNFVVIADSYFGSLTLAEKLHNEGWRFILCCRNDRPSGLFKGKLADCLRKGEWQTAVRPDRKILAVTFFDKKKISFLTNCYSDEPVQHKKADQPEVVRKYNMFMHGVDKGDAFANRYLYKHKKLKWTKAVLFLLMKQACVNSWLIFNHHNKANLTQRQYLENLCLSIEPRRHKVVRREQHWVFHTGKKQRCQHCARTLRTTAPLHMSAMHVGLLCMPIAFTAGIRTWRAFIPLPLRLAQLAPVLMHPRHPSLYLRLPLAMKQPRPSLNPVRLHHRPPLSPLLPP
jgi:hypothetical protein